MLEMLRTSHNPFSSLPYISVFYQTFVSSLIIFDYFPIFIRAISFFTEISLVHFCEQLEDMVFVMQ